MHKAMTKNTYFPRLWVSAKNADMLKPGLPWGLREQSLSCCLCTSHVGSSASQALCDLKRKLPRHLAVFLSIICVSHSSLPRPPLVSFSCPQVGLPDSRAQYVHRLGRTGRAGRAGKGLLILAPFERPFLAELDGVECPEDPAALLAASDAAMPGAAPEAAVPSSAASSAASSATAVLRPGRVFSPGKLAATLAALGEASARSGGATDGGLSPEGALAKVRGLRLTRASVSVCRPAAICLHASRVQRVPPP